MNFVKGMFLQTRLCFNSKLNRMKEYFRRETGLKTFLLFVFLVLVFSIFTFPKKLMAASEESVISAGHSNDDINRGKRFFMGLLPFDRKYESCVSCHNIKQVDTLNWNPSAFEIAIKYAEKDFASFQIAVMQPSGVKMSASHQNFNIEEEDLKTVKAYLDNMAHEGSHPIKPSYFNLILFVFLGLLLTWALLDLIFFRKVKWKIVPLVIFLGAFGWQVKMIVTDAIRLGRQQYYAPDQPVKFSHKVHAGDHGIDCMYCHTTVEQSKSAGIPPVSLCLNCHILIREGTNSGKFEIAKVVEASEKGIPIEWIRIHNLPDHVYFNHAQHVNAGKLDCNQCHGQVENMHKVMQVNDLSMGWCLDCHRTSEVQFLGNSFYETYEKLHEQIKKGEITKVTPAMVGGEDCMKCHH
jgi:hypothetical protein